jgi:hypothetical protein
MTAVQRMPKPMLAKAQGKPPGSGGLVRRAWGNHRDHSKACASLFPIKRDRVSRDAKAEA